MEKPWLYIPIETKVRELQGKTLLASFAAINGFNVIVGSKKDINAKSALFPKGIVFNVGLANNLAKVSRKFRKEGHRVAVIDEEGLVTLKDDIYLYQRVSEDGLELADWLFCWGKKQASLIRGKAAGANCQLFVTGNPRFDMLRPEYKLVFEEKVQKIKEKYGKFILINTNFGRGNHFSGDDYMLDSLKQKGWMNTPEDEKFILDNVAWQKRMFGEFQRMVPQIAKRFKGYNVIIRPHPSENHDPWKKIAKIFPNIFVVYSDSSIPWIMAADVLIHNGCTTAIEAFILGTKAVAYRPFIIEEQETKLPNEISLESYNPEELVDTVRKILKDASFGDYASKRKHLNYFLSGIDEKTASEQIIFILKSVAKSNKKRINIPLIFLFDFLERCVFTARKIISGESKDYMSLKYQLHKNPSLNKTDFSEAIKNFSKINKRFLNLKVRRVGGSCYQIYEGK